MSSGPLKHVRVLVAHRDASMRSGAARLLSGVGAEVVVYGDRVSAHEAVRAARPQFVLLDHGLDEGGHALVRDVAGDPELLGVAVVLMWPDAGVDDIVDALRE